MPHLQVSQQPFAKITLAVGKFTQNNSVKPTHLQKIWKLLDV
ncbi:hypothetical protein [Nostoc sp.]